MVSRSMRALRGCVSALAFYMLQVGTCVAYGKNSAFRDEESRLFTKSASLFKNLMYLLLNNQCVFFFMCFRDCLVCWTIYLISSSS